MTRRHEPEDWVPEYDGELLMRYRCLRCNAWIAAVVVLCGEAEEQHWRDMLPGRLVMGVFRSDRVEMSDGRDYARLTGRPVCTTGRLELEAS